MGLFGKRRNRRRLESVGDGPEGTAVIRASESVGAARSRTGPETILDLEPNVFGTRAYSLTLEVRLAGREPYEVTGMFDVPKKAENLNFFDTANTLKPGIELPVRVDAADAAKVAVDWDKFMADPGGKKAVKAAKEAGQRASVAKAVAKKPKMQAKSRGGAPDARRLRADAIGRFGRQGISKVFRQITVPARGPSTTVILARQSPEQNRPKEVVGLRTNQGSTAGRTGVATCASSRV